MRTAWTRFLAAALVCLGGTQALLAAETTTQHLFTSFNSFTVPATTTRLEFVVRGASGESPWGRGRAGRGAEISFSLAYGHGYTAGDVLWVLPGKQGDQSHASASFKGGRAGDLVYTSDKPGGWGGGASGIYNASKQRWLVVAGGGGGVGGPAAEAGGHGGDAGQPGGGGLILGEPIGGSGGAAPAPCAAEPFGLDFGAGARGHAASSSQASYGSGSGGGGGGGCTGGGGGGSRATAPGGGGGGGSSWIGHSSTNVLRGLAPTGPGSVLLTLTTFTEPPPIIVSRDRAVFVVGRAACFDVVGMGSPPPDVHVSGQFPEGVTFRVPLFSGMGELRGTPTAASVGTHRISLTMRNDWGVATQELTLEVVTPDNAPRDADVCSP